MSVTQVSCPRCRAPLKSDPPVAVGTSVKCVRCGTRFVVSISTPIARPSAALTGKPPEPQAPEPEFPSLPSATIPIPRPAPASQVSLLRSPLLIPLLAGALLLVGVGIAIGVYAFAGGKKEPQVVIATPPEQPKPPSVPPPVIPPKPAEPFAQQPTAPISRGGEEAEEVPVPREATPEVRENPPVPVVKEEPPRDPLRLDMPADPKKPEPGKPPVVKVKPLTRGVLASLEALAKKQNADGSWGSGDPFGGGFFVIGVPQPHMERGDVANTSIAALALLRAGAKPGTGWGAINLRKGVDWICAQVEKADKETLFVTDLKGTQVQGKIGTHVDTFLAALVLAEVKGKMPDAKSEARVATALQKIVDKMQKNQKPDGTWANEGWAPVLSQALASKALNRARQVGITVEDAVLEKTAKNARDNFEKHVKNFKDGAQMGFGAAGVALYAAAAYIGALHDAVQTHRHLGEMARGVLHSPASTEQERKEAEAQLKKLEDWEKILEDAVAAIARKLADEQFVRGFGSDGGEEYLSYMIISETLHTKNSKELPKWDKLMTDRLTFAQNGDALWSGHHCITGRTFCTATALLTLLADRAALRK